MKFKFILPLLAILALSGCRNDNGNDPDVVEHNRRVLSGDGELVGTLKDGRTVSRFRIDRYRRGESDGDHFIYIVSDSSSVTSNHQIRHGKISINAVEVNIEEKK